MDPAATSAETSALRKFMANDIGLALVGWGDRFLVACRHGPANGLRGGVHIRELGDDVACITASILELKIRYIFLCSYY